MKIKYKGPKEDIPNLIEKMKNGDIEFVLSGEDFELKKQSAPIVSIIGEIDNDFVIIHYKDIIFVESYAHEVLCHTSDGVYRIKEKLYEVEGLFTDYGFLRIHKSYVVNIKQIKRIVPEFNRKFRLILTNDKKVEVSRRYFVEFKEAIGMKV